MKILLVTRAGGRIQSKKGVSSSWLRVGRNASCEVHLPDPRVALDQGMVTRPDEGFMYVEGELGAQNITRKAVRQVRMEPGQPIEVGPYRLTLQPAPGPEYEAQLDVELVHPLGASSDLAGRSRHLTLGSLGLTKRWAAWLWAFIVLGVFLALPAGRVLDLPWREAAQASTFGDRFWNPGPVMLAHQPIAAKCASCHEAAFERVKDRACLECHARVGHHLAPQARPASLFAEERCATCHREHKGVKSTHRDDDGLCVSCHQDLRSRAPGAQALDAGDFGRAHPQFRLSLPGESGVQRVRMGTVKPVEASNLTFPHATHLAAAGVRSPLQGRMKLECRSCHALDASGRGFQPISMPRHCQECHALQFEPAVTTREVPHGQPGEALVVLEEFYGNLALQGVADSFQKAFGVAGEGLLRRAGEPSAAQRENALRLARRKAQQVGEEMFEVRVCKTCHAVTRVASAGDKGGVEAFEWRIAPVRANTSWMPQARFDHKAHGHVKCAECHAVAQSKLSTDVSMPAIETCRECHAGSRPAEGKVMSNCLLCHGFHDARHPWDPFFEPKVPQRSSGKVAGAR
jgi:predicted CXXCH cytochrome family protein